MKKPKKLKESKASKELKEPKKSNKYHPKKNNCHVFATHLVLLIVIRGKLVNMPKSSWTRPINSRIARRSQRRPQQNNTPTIATGELDAKGYDSHSAIIKDETHFPKYRHVIPGRDIRPQQKNTSPMATGELDAEGHDGRSVALKDKARLLEIRRRTMRNRGIADRKKANKVEPNAKQRAKA